MQGNKKIIIVVMIILILWKNTCFARFYQIIDAGNFYASIAEPIFVVDSSKDILEFKANKENINREYYFTVKNSVDDGDTIRISEVDLAFFITLVKSNNSIPIFFKLFDLSNNEEIPLDDSNKTSEIMIPKNILFEKQYKVVVFWDESLKLYENVDVEIIIDASQKTI